MSEAWTETGRAEPSELTGEHWNIEYRAGSMTADVRADGCVHIRQEWNVGYPSEDSDYIHICDLDAHIAKLQALRERIRQDYGPEWK